MSRVLILGYGNPLRGDDGFGWRAAARLAERIPEARAQVAQLHQLTPEWMEPVSQAERVIFIDAAADGEPGRLTRRAVEVAEGRAALAFTHDMSPEGLLAGAKTLYGRAPEAELWSVGVVNVEPGETLTPEVERALADVVERICAIT
jgi:hydrogenase maturation protease